MIQHKAFPNSLVKLFSVHRSLLRANRQRRHAKRHIIEKYEALLFHCKWERMSMQTHCCLWPCSTSSLKRTNAGRDMPRKSWGSAATEDYREKCKTTRVDRISQPDASSPRPVVLVWFVHFLAYLPLKLVRLSYNDLNWCTWKMTWFVLVKIVADLKFCLLVWCTVLKKYGMKYNDQFYNYIL